MLEKKELLNFYGILYYFFFFEEFHRQAIIAFIISGTLHMLIQTITSLWRKKDQQKVI